MELKSTGKKIKEQRLRKNISQEKLAEIIDVSPSYISNLESGNRVASLPTMLAIVNVLDLSFDYLMLDNLKTKYFKQTKCVPKSAKPSYNKINTLYSANKIGNKLIISRFKSINKSILLISNGEEFTTGIHELKINDDVYVASKKPDYFTFAHYQMISLNEENNCNLVFSKRIYDTDEILKLPVKRYKTFMQDFIEQFSF